MPISLSLQKLNTIRAVQAATVLAVLLAATAPARADTISVADMLRGINMTSAQCAAIPQTAWITATNRNFCMRYYLAPFGREAHRPVVFLQGDRLGPLNLRSGSFTLPANEKDINTDDLMKAAFSLSKQTKTTAIYLARVGVEGSSGDHRLRHTVLELNVTNAALDAIKRQYGFEGFHLIGQSGGAKLVVGLLALRQDIGCAIIGSGLFSVTKPMRPPTDPALGYFNTADILPVLARYRAARIMVVTDQADKKVGAQNQNIFVQKLQQAGRLVEQFNVQAMDENRHGVVAYSRVVASGCLRGAGTEEIAREVDLLVQRRLAAAKAKAQSPADAR